MARVRAAAPAASAQAWDDPFSISDHAPRVSAGIEPTWREMIPLSSAYWLVSERLRGGVPAAVALHLVGNVALTVLAVTSPVAMAVYVGVIVLTSVLVHLVTRPGTPRP